MQVTEYSFYFMIRAVPEIIGNAQPLSYLIKMIYLPGNSQVIGKPGVGLNPDHPVCQEWGNSVF